MCNQLFTVPLGLYVSSAGKSMHFCIAHALVFLLLAILRLDVGPYILTVLRLCAVQCSCLHTYASV